MCCVAVCLAVITGALPRWPTLAMPALRRVVRLASHPVLFANMSHLFPDEYLAPTRRAQARTLTARAATSPTVSSEAVASTMNSSLLRAVRGRVSVGENAVALVNETNT